MEAVKLEDGSVMVVFTNEEARYVSALLGGTVWRQQHDSVAVQSLFERYKVSERFQSTEYGPSYSNDFHMAYFSAISYLSGARQEDKEVTRITWEKTAGELAYE